MIYAAVAVGGVVIGLIIAAWLYIRMWDRKWPFKP